MDFKKNEEYNKFRENIKEIIKEELFNELKSNNFYKSYSGVVLDVQQVEGNTDPFQQRCGVDLVFTQVRSLLNKTGQFLKIGDTVIIFEKIGSNLSNCFIAYKSN
jgi:hypothetical protein